MPHPTSINPIKILVVDDLPEKLLVYRSILDELGEEVLTARSGEEALKRILHDDVAVILLDVNMPGMDGFETAAMIRRRARSAHTPIIFITAFADEMHETRGYSLGAVDYILAPVNPDVLRTKVRVFVDLNRLTRQVREQTARQLAEAQSERARLSAELENATDFVGRADTSGRMLSVNAAGRRMLGLGPNDPLPPTLDDYLSPAARELVRQTGLATARREGVWFGETSLRAQAAGRGVHAAAGQEIPVSLVILAHRNDPANTESFSIIARDITRRRQAEAELARHHARLEELVGERTAELHASLERLRLADRLASIGTLAAGLGHDMGNLLLPIRMRLDTLERINLPPDIREDLQAIKTAGEYLQRLCKGLRLFALDPDDDDFSPPMTALGQWWSEVEPFLRNSLQRNVTLQCTMPPDLPAILIPPHRFTQVIYNLFQNANDALRDRAGGQVTISAALASSGDRVEIRVADNGPGMSDDVRRRCLEPFFTTKTRGISTGLGLALVHGAVSKAGGTLEIDSRPGCGSTFIISLPAARSIEDSHGESSRPSRAIAWIGLRDQRLNAYVTAVLRSMHIEAIRGDWPPDPDATLLILDASNGHYHHEEIEAYLAGDGGRHAIVIGGEAGVHTPPQMMCIESKPSPSTIRAAIHAMLDREVRQESLQGSTIPFSRDWGTRP